MSKRGGTHWVKHLEEGCTDKTFSSRACLHFCLLTVICGASDMATVIVTVDVPEVKYLSKNLD